MESVFSFLDYREFLRAFYQRRKQRRAGYSYRAFSKRVGLRSTNYLKLVIDGERNLSPEMAERFGEACGLEGGAREYFVRLVAFNQASNSVEREAHYQTLLRSKRYRRAQRLDARHAEYAGHWYLPAIRELAARPDFRQDARWIARTLLPRISETEAQRALDTLFELGLLVQEGNGRATQGSSLLSTGPETASVHVARYHREMMHRASESIDLVPSQERDISSITVCLSASGLARMKERIHGLRRELLELSELEAEPKQVVQLNLQLFPLSRVDEREDETDGEPPRAPKKKAASRRKAGTR